MLRRWLPAGSVLAIAAAVVLLVPQTSSAQFRRGWGGWGERGLGFGVDGAGFYYGTGSPYTYGFYPGYNSGYYGWNYPTYGSTWYPSNYGGYGWNTPFYSRWSRPTYSYDFSTPSYYSSGIPSGTMGSFYSSDMSNRGYYGAPMGETFGQQERTVLIDVRVPPSAEIWFEDAKTQQTGTFRAFISPTLEPGQDYVYHVRTRWMENGQPVEKTRDLRVRAGDQLSIDFLNEAAAGSTPSGEPYRGTTPRYGTDRNMDRNAPGTDRIDEQRGTDRNLDRTNPSERTSPGTTPPGGTTTPGGTSPGTRPSQTPGSPPPE